MLSPRKKKDALGTHNRGVVFRMDKAGKVIVLHSFTLGTDGGNPGGPLIEDSAGKLYGTTFLEGPQYHDAQCDLSL